MVLETPAGTGVLDRPHMAGGVWICASVPAGEARANPDLTLQMCSYTLPFS